LSTLIAQASQAVYQDKDEEHKEDREDKEDKFIDIDTMDLDEFIDPQLRALSTTQIGMQRLQGRSDTYKPGTLPPQLYQIRPIHSHSRQSPPIQARFSTK
jgi:hypothetical protein